MSKDCLNNVSWQDLMQRYVANECLKKSCLLECKESAAEHQVCVKQKLMHMYGLPKSSRRLCSNEA